MAAELIVELAGVILLALITEFVRPSNAPFSGPKPRHPSSTHTGRTNRTSRRFVSTRSPGSGITGRSGAAPQFSASGSW